MSQPFSFHPDWFKWLNRLEGVDQRRVNKAIVDFQSNPDLPGLNLEPMVGVKEEFWTIRASESIRIAMIKVKQGWIFCRAGYHDLIDNFVNSAKLVVNSEEKVAKILSNENVGSPIEELDEEVLDPSVSGAKSSRKRIFRAWDEKSLIAAGIPKDWATLILSCVSEDDLLYADVNHGIPEDVIDLALGLLGRSPKDFEAKGLLTVEEKKEVLVKWGKNSELSKFFTSTDELEKLFSGEIERWMVWPHPRQWDIIEAKNSGPAQVRGGAGTGKTVVALHRAAELARRFRNQQLSLTNKTKRPKPIAFITFNNNLTDVFGNLYNRIPETREEEVQFLTCHRLALNILQVNNVDYGNLKTGEEQFSESFSEIVTSGTPLDRSTNQESDFFKDYLFIEVEAVICGRGILNESDYLDLQRTGRKHPLGPQQRKQVWELYLDWRERLRRDNVVTYTQILFLALEVLQNQDDPIYRSVIIDEVQDLSLVGLNLIQRAVNGAGEDQSDGLLIVGDGAQRLYKHCWNLQEAGINIQGRSTILTKNYRNTDSILKFALAVTEGEEVIGLNENFQRSAALSESEVTGGVQPKLIICNSSTEEVIQIVSEIRNLVNSFDVTYGDILILLRHNEDVATYKRMLAQRQIPTSLLKDYDGTPSESVQIGTYHRSKGLESKVVIIPDMTKGTFLPSDKNDNEDEESYQERIDLELNQFWVASTRARDFLVLTCHDEESDFIKRALDHIELVDARN